jgi:hypothetical protein
VIHDDGDEAAFMIATPILIGDQQGDGLRLIHVVRDQLVKIRKSLLQFGEHLALHAFALGAAGGKEEIKPHLLGDASAKGQTQSRCKPGKGEKNRHSECT